MEDTNDFLKQPVNVESTSLSAPEPLTAPETTQIISSMYDIAGPRVGSFLVEANNVLTIAGARGQTEFYIFSPIEEDQAAVSRLDNTFKSQGISFSTTKVIKRQDKPDFIIVNLESLKGFERVSKTTKIPGVIPYDSKSGWDGLKEWEYKVWGNLVAEQEKGTIPFPLDEIADIFTGIKKGYPDQAIYDATEWWGLNDRKTPIEDTHIPYVKKYRGAEPNFAYRPDHAHDPSIQATVQSWGKILEDFYNQPWHKTVSEDQNFVNMRKLIDESKM